MLCPQIAPATVTQELLSLGKRQLSQLIRLWHCFLNDYAEHAGILDAAENITSTFHQVINRLINLHLPKVKCKFYGRVCVTLKIWAVIDLLAARKTVEIVLSETQQVKINFV